MARKSRYIAYVKKAKEAKRKGPAKAPGIRKGEEN